jgi:hypothetical protein
MFSFARSVPCYGWLRWPSRLKMNSLRSALTATATSQTITPLSGQRKTSDMNLPNHNNC